MYKGPKSVFLVSWAASVKTEGILNEIIWVILKS